MTEDTPTSRPTHTAGAGAEASAGSSPSGQGLKPLSMIWRVLASPTTLVALLGFVALAVALAAVIPQMPPQAADDPQAWLAVQLGVSGQAGGFIYALGLFDIAHAFWFHMLLALMGLTLFVWCVETASLAWKATARKRWGAADFASWGREAPQISLLSSHSSRTALSRLHELLDQTGYAWVDVSGMADPNQVAVRRALALWAEPVVYCALLATLLGMGIVSNWGWQAQDWQPAPGESYSVGHGTVYTIRLDEFELRQDGAGQVLDYGSTITWLQDGTAVGQGRVSSGRPIMLPGVTVRQVGYAPVIQMRGKDDTGRPLAFQAEAEGLSVSTDTKVVLSTPDDQALILVLGHDRFLALTFEPACAQGKPVLQISLLQAGSLDTSSAEQRARAVIHESGRVELENLTVEVDLGYHPILQVEHRPGAGLILAGMMVALSAMAVGWLVRPQLLWIAVSTGEGGLTLVQILAPPKMRGSLWRQPLASRLGEMLSDDG